MKPALSLIACIFFLLIHSASAQTDIYKFRTKAAFYSDSSGVHETPIWKIYPEGSDILIVYDVKRKKINGYGKEAQDLSIIKQVFLKGENDEPDMESITCVDQNNHQCDATIILYKKTNENVAPKKYLILDYGPVKFKFELVFD